jgi:hypothetical protein
MKKRRRYSKCMFVLIRNSSLKGSLLTTISLKYTTSGKIPTNPQMQKIRNGLMQVLIKSNLFLIIVLCGLFFPIIIHL